MTAPTPAQATAGAARIRVFVDYWNFQLTINARESRVQRKNDVRFAVDWKKLGPWLAQKAAATAGITNHVYEGVTIYTSYNPTTAEGKKFHQWVRTWLDRQPGIQVECRERKPRSLPICSTCHQQVAVCPHCGKPFSATVEKGVDTLIATDMIRLAWQNSYDIAVLASLDSDLVPAVEFLGQRGLKVIQAGFPPAGLDLATACWASFDVFHDRAEITRP